MTKLRSKCTITKPYGRNRIGKLTLIFALIVIIEAHLQFAESCSSRTLPKQRPTTSSSIISKPIEVATTTQIPSTTTTATTTISTSTTTPRPNTTFPIYKCPAVYDAWYCLNSATCFSVKIGDSTMYNCECAIGFMGPRCEYKELDGSLLPKRPRPILEMASLASGATCALLFVFFVCITIFLRYDKRVTSTNIEKLISPQKKGVCRFCNDKQCCGNVNYSPSRYSRVDSAKYRSNSNLWQQHIETAPMSFAIKRTTKL